MYDAVFLGGPKSGTHIETTIPGDGWCLNVEHERSAPYIYSFRIVEKGKDDIRVYKYMDHLNDSGFTKS